MQYVQGGGCTSVGVVGWHIGGGYGSWSKKFGTGPANMLEAKVVTADGRVVVASEFQNEGDNIRQNFDLKKMSENQNSSFLELFYALRGGGFGFGVVVSLTVRTHPLPDHLGVMSGSVVSYRGVSLFFYPFYCKMFNLNYHKLFVILRSLVL